MQHAHFHKVDGEPSDKVFGLSKLSYSDLVTLFFSHILIGVTNSLLVYFVLGS